MAAPARRITTAATTMYVNAMVLRDRDTDLNTAGLEERGYAVHDANFNITALVDDSGAVIRRQTSPMGRRIAT